MTTFYTLLYVSEASRTFQDDPDVGRIVTVSVKNNKTADVTGALIYSGTHFAQYLEGPKSHIESLMKRIEMDGRHHALEVTATRFVRKRLFANWSLAYAGQSKYVRDQLSLLFFADGDAAALESGRMITLMEDLVSIRAKLGLSVH